MTKFKTALKYLLVILAAIAIGLGIINAYFNNHSTNDIPMPFGYGLSVVLTGSMEPAISAEDLIVIMKTDEFAPGDIVVYQNGGTHAVVHRVVSIDEDLVTTKGDANNTEDKPFSKSHVIGKVIAVIPFLGSFILAVKTPAGMICALAVAVILIAMPFGRRKQMDADINEDIKDEIKRLKEELEETKNK